ncbi:unnamed protein product [Parascedosporium putredinis]|uniref:hydroxymethylbilane synthase n=1 Tax=Parascedosporium putredinis TaxID=1442378 RepID=A0A9P1H3S4_9PEZI|nr:unnamed protein product [Parascedosporium putredinis]CAI7994975.1 unnamed protein product [Parascedosporium putredinis]
MSASEATRNDPAPAKIVVGTRESALALKQTHLVIEGLQKLRPDIKFEVNAMKTIGDKDQLTALYKFGGKGLWTNELEAKLEVGAVDIIVHSLKDMPTTLPEGFILGCSLEGKYKTIGELPKGSVIGTSSIRRIAQLKRRYPHLEFADVRGNIQTRLRKGDDEEGPFSAIILAAAGLLRLDFGDRIAQYLDSASAGILHAVGQGALGVEARKSDKFVLNLLKEFEDNQTMLACWAERSVMRTLEGGCSVPIGVETRWVNGRLRLSATVVNFEGNQFADVEEEAAIETQEEADIFGREVARKLTEKGADKILDAIKQVTEK